MDEKNEPKRRVRRTKSTIDKDVILAVSSLIEEVGFANVTLTAVAQRAQIEPTVFYRRYKNLVELFDQYTRKYDYWLGNIAEIMPPMLSYKDQYKWIISSMTSALYRSKGMQQLLIWELSNDNDVTKRTTRLREATNEPLIKLMTDLGNQGEFDLCAASALIIAGIYYNVLVRKKTTFCGVDFSTKIGKERMLNVINSMGDIIFEHMSRKSELHEIESRLKNEGVDPKIIQRCLYL